MSIYILILQRALEEKKSLKVEAKNAERAAMHSFHDKEAVLEIYTKVVSEIVISILSSCNICIHIGQVLKLLLFNNCLSMKM